MTRFNDVKAMTVHAASGLAVAWLKRALWSARVSAHCVHLPHLPAGSRLVRGMRADSARARMLINLDAEFTARFGHWDRFDPHPPSIRLIEQRWLRELYSKTADLFRRTSAAHIRYADMLIRVPRYVTYLTGLTICSWLSARAVGGNSCCHSQSCLCGSSRSV